MENVKNTYCRFCAELKSTDKVLNLQLDDRKCDEIHLKLAFLNALYVNVNSDNILPKTVCFVCYDSLNKAYEFLDKVRRSQDVLSSLFSGNEGFKYGTSDDDKATGFDDFLANDDSDHEYKIGCGISGGVNVKIEPFEFSESNMGEDMKQPGSPSQENFNTDSLNVQDIIDAAMSTSNITLYEKDVSEVSKKVVKTWKDYPWLCAYCNIEFLDMDTLRSHAKVVHGKCSAFMCVDCKVVKKDNFTSFIKHVRKHRKSLRDYCHYCDEIINPGETKNKHMKKHFVKPQVACPGCGEIQKDEEELKFHRQEFSQTKHKRRPRRKKGTPITLEEVTCHLCKKIYKTPNSLRDHMKLHTVDRKRNYTCDRCGKMFYNKGTLTSHIMSHDKVRPHVCKICNKSFLFPNMLRRHVEMHSGVKPFPCEMCGRCFRLQYQLNAHKIIHTDAMPHVCTYCNKAFRFKQILKNHERLHTGAKPYSCSQCHMEFTNWSNYNKHMKRRHGMDTSKKKITPEGVFPINPETGQIMQVQDPIGTEEWKSKIMIPAKRGKKKKNIKVDSHTN
ncbi:gastrula zinc finger protein XlCGF26.1-like [Ostrinia furnacalis]|uniref:gastrula zinc finger protein XlCGF26.1-like n=1 Tax=Ostrinia furnacalis TaxID=93504 RepID=UPI00103C9F7C|nr:gastrula zinc finger protein XlCGF26.1-like [Ostrinia furnacalis]